jgi:hypothetical protein
MAARKINDVVLNLGNQPIDSRMNPKILDLPLHEILELASDAYEAREKEEAEKEKLRKENNKLINARRMIRRYILSKTAAEIAKKANMSLERLHTICIDPFVIPSEEEKTGLCRALAKSYDVLWENDSEPEPAEPYDEGR